MTDTDRLFDVTDYGGAEPTPKERRTAKPSAQRAELPVEPHQDPWVLVRDRGGVKPYHHLVIERSGLGAVTTVCKLVGTQISGPFEKMIRCPECDMGAQMAQLPLPI